MRTKNNFLVATLNVGGSQEAGVYAEALVEEHGCSVVGVTETHCKMEGKVRTRYPQLGAPRPCSHGDKGHGGVALIVSASVEFSLTL